LAVWFHDAAARLVVVNRVGFCIVDGILLLDVGDVLFEVADGEEFFW
jgi:hypothetical protein